MRRIVTYMYILSLGGSGAIHVRHHIIHEDHVEILLRNERSVVRLQFIE